MENSHGAPLVPWDLLLGGGANEHKCGYDSFVFLVFRVHVASSYCVYGMCTCSSTCDVLSATMYIYKYTFPAEHGTVWPRQPQATVLSKTGFCL